MAVEHLEKKFIWPTIAIAWRRTTTASTIPRPRPIPTTKQTTTTTTTFLGCDSIEIKFSIKMYISWIITKRFGYKQ